MGVHAPPEAVKSKVFTRGIRYRTPSAFIEGEYVQDPSQDFERWLYRRGFRPAWDNFLGETEELNQLDILTICEYVGYYRNMEKQLSATSGKPPLLYRLWMPKGFATFVIKITKIKKLVR